MNDCKPCHADGYCMFFNDELNTCINSNLCEKREKLEYKLLKKCGDEFYNGSQGVWQAFVEKVEREVAEAYPCKYNISRNSLKRWIESQPCDDNVDINLFGVFES